MGNLIIYNGQVIGDVAKRRWRVMRRLLTILIDYVNTAMDEKWQSGAAFNIAVRTNSSSPAKLPPSDATPPWKGHFQFDSIFSDQSERLDEIILLNRDELHRLYEWYEFLSVRDGALELFEPLVEALRERTGTVGQGGAIE